MYIFHFISCFSELLQGDKANREKKRMAEAKTIAIEQKREAERKRREEGYCFESEIFEPEERIDDATLLPENLNDPQILTGL